MSTDDLNNQQTSGGTAADNDVENTPAANVTPVNANTTAFEEVDKMFSTFEKKSTEQKNVMSSLAKQVENITTRTMVVFLRRTTQIRGRRLDFTTPSDRSGSVLGKPSGKNPDEVNPAPTRKNPEDLPPVVEDKEEGEI